MHPTSRRPLRRSDSPAAAPPAASPADQASGPVPGWLRALSRYEKPNLKRAIGQLLDTFLPYLGLWVLMVWMLRRGVPYWATIPLMVVAAGLVVRDPSGRAVPTLHTPGSLVLVMVAGYYILKHNPRFFGR